MTAPPRDDTAIDIARRETARGRAVIPLPFMSKNPNFTGWQKLRLSEEDLDKYFNGRPQNVGILNGTPSSGLVDVDLDWLEAALVAHRFLPDTGSVFGRTSAPASHRFYLADPLPKTTKFRARPDGSTESPDDEDDDTRHLDDDRMMIVEFRSTGTQTVAPGSVHTSGEVIDYQSDGEPALVDGRVLLGAVQQLAACALIAGYWEKSLRHDAALALAGGLLRAGWEVETVEHFIESVAIAAGDDEVADRITAVRDTDKALRDNTEATGWPTLGQTPGRTDCSPGPEVAGRHVRRAVANVGQPGRRHDHEHEHHVQRSCWPALAKKR